MSVFFGTFPDVSGTSFGAVDAPRGPAESLRFTHGDSQRYNLL